MDQYTGFIFFMKTCFMLRRNKQLVHINFYRYLKKTFELRSTMCGFPVGGASSCRCRPQQFSPLISCKNMNWGHFRTPTPLLLLLVWGYQLSWSSSSRRRRSKLELISKSNWVILPISFLRSALSTLDLNYLPAKQINIQGASKQKGGSSQSVAKKKIGWGDSRDLLPEIIISLERILIFNFMMSKEKMYYLYIKYIKEMVHWMVHNS